jgi:hypothetical protein
MGIKSFVRFRYEQRMTSLQYAAHAEKKATQAEDGASNSPKRWSVKPKLRKDNENKKEETQHIQKTQDWV